MKRNIVGEKSFTLAVEVVETCRRLQEQHREYILSKQLLRSGTAIGALVREAEHAESRADFIHKCAIAQKEANETLYWLELMKQTGYLTQSQFTKLHTDTVEVLKLLTRIILTARKNLSKL